MENIISISDRVKNVNLVPMSIGDTIKELMSESDFYQYMRLVNYDHSTIHDILNDRYEYELKDYIMLSFIFKKPVFYFENIQKNYMRGSVEED